MLWKNPPKIKIYEALGCIADERLEISGNSAKVFSSSKGKFYTVDYDGENSIRCNDNGSYWVGYLGYPAIAFLMLKGKIKYDSKFSEALKEIAWKGVNTKFKNDYVKTLNFVLDTVKERGYNVNELEEEVEKILDQIKNLKMEFFGSRTKPPRGY